MKKSLILLIKFFFAIILFYFLLKSTQLQLTLFLQIFQHLYLTLFVIFFFLMMVWLNALRWYELNKSQHIPLTFPQTLLPTYLGIAFNNVLPGGIGGDFVRIHYTLKKIIYSRSKIVMSILVDRITGLLSIFIAICLVSFFRLTEFYNNPNLYFLLLACILISGSFFILIFLSMILPDRIGLSHWLSQYVNHSVYFKKILNFFEIIRSYRQNKFALIKALFLSLIIQIIMVMTISLITSILHLPSIHWFDYLIAVGLTQIANLIPLAPGGLGIGELAFVHVLTILNPGIIPGYATVFLAYRLFGTISYLPGIVYYLINFNRLKTSSGVINAEYQ